MVTGNQQIPGSPQESGEFCKGEIFSCARKAIVRHNSLLKQIHNTENSLCAQVSAFLIFTFELRNGSRNDGET